MGVCERKECAEYVESGRITVFVGGYSAALCPKCTNDWHEIVGKHFAYGRLHKQETKLLQIALAARAGVVPSLAELELVEEAVDEAKASLFVFAADWIAERKD